MKRVIQLRSSGGLLGAERVILELSRFLPQHGYLATVVALWDEGDPYPELLTEAKRLGLAVEAISCRSKFDWSAIQALRKLCTTQNADVLHCHGYKEDIYGSFVSLPKIATNHLWKRSTASANIYSYLDAVALRFFNHIVAVSQPVLQDMRSVWLPESKMSIIPNGIEPTLFMAKQPAYLVAQQKVALGLSDQLVAITVSSLTIEKGHETLFKAIAQLRNRGAKKFSLLVVGDGPQRSALDAMVRQFNLADTVSFLNARTDIALLLSLADVFVLPSYREGLPIAMLEAMAAGKAVVASDVGDVGFALDQGKAGMLVAAGDSEALSVALERLFEDSLLREQLGQAAQQRVEKSFSAESMAAAYAKRYDLLGKE